MKSRFVLRNSYSIALLLCLFVSPLSHAQNDAPPPSVRTSPKQAIYFEVLGNGLTYSFNYDSRFTKSDHGLGARIGISYLTVDQGNEMIFTLTVVLNCLLGKDSKYFELGIGGTFYGSENDFFLTGEDSDSPVIGTMIFGFRHQPLDDGFMWRIAVTPVLYAGDFIPYFGGFSLGYTFK